MKKTTVIGVAMLLILLLMNSCGVNQELYDKVRTDLVTVQSEKQALQNDLSTAQAEIGALRNDLNNSQSEKLSLQGDLDAAHKQIQTLQDDLSAQESELIDRGSELESVRENLEEGNARVEVLNAILIPTLTGEIYSMTQSEAMDFFLEWRDKVIAIEDPTLTAKFQAIIDTSSDEATMSFFLYLLESIPEALGYRDVSSSGT